MITFPQSSSSSFGSSSSNFFTDRPTFPYDVFLSFHGEDTRFQFIGYLFEALTNTGIITYRDDEDLRQGRFISPELLQAIDTSASAVVVLSSNYAYSKWCLDELAHIVKCKEDRGLLVYPVFYHVDPSDVRNWRGSFRPAFDEHERDSRISKKKLEAWKSAFKIVGGIAGTHVKRDRYELNYVSDIVTRINQYLRDILPREDIGDLVGIESRVNEVCRILCLQSDDVRFVGIYGMSGTGKTFLARYVYNRIRKQFDCCSFVHGIKNVLVETDDFCKLQQQIIDDGLNNNKNNNTRVANFMDGDHLLRNLLYRKKFLLVLDDLYRKDQLKHLARERSWFGTGSRIIITTTNKDVLKAAGIEDDQKYECGLLEYDDAKRLFCKEAFGVEHPKQGFEKLTDDVLSLAGGLPLAIVVFGKALLGEEDECDWRETVQMLQQYPDNNITGRLEVFYRRLDTHEQEVFIYLACFFSGCYHSDFCKALKDTGLYPSRGINVLCKRSFVNYDNDLLSVHDQLKRMCWEVLRKEFPEEPGKRMALKSRRDIFDILTSEEGGQAIRIISDESYYHAETEKICGHRKAFFNMRRLMVLRIQDVDFPDGIDNLSSELRFLQWRGCSLKSFPPTFKPRHLIKLSMRNNSELEHLWENVIEMPNLEEIDLSESEKLTKIPDLSKTPKLKSLYLRNCTSLVEVHPSVLIHNSLEVVTLNGCKRLESLGSESLDMEALVHLDLGESEKLTKIPDLSKTPKLKRLYLSNCTSLVEVHPSVVIHNSLEDVKLNGCKRLESLGSESFDMEALVLLDLSHCSNLQMIPEFGERTRRLSELYLDESGLKKLPDSLGVLRSLSRLSMRRTYIQELPSSIYQLENLHRLDVSECRYLDLSLLTNTQPEIPQGFNLDHCNLFGNESVTIDASTWNSRRWPPLFTLDSCKNLRTLPNLPRSRSRKKHELQVDFLYFISAREIDFSLICMAGRGCRVISCVNCPRLVENESGGGVAVAILKKYMQVGNLLGDISPALFQIAAAGSEISPWFSHYSVGNSVHIDLPNRNWYNDAWIGIALCTVIHHPKKVAKNIITGFTLDADIYADGRSIKIPFPSLSTSTIDEQVVRYVSITNYLRQLVDWSQIAQLFISFNLPHDGELSNVKSCAARMVYKTDLDELVGGGV